MSAAGSRQIETAGERGRMRPLEASFIVAGAAPF